MSHSSSPRQAWLPVFCLVIVTLLWGTTFPGMKAVASVMPPGLMVGIRWLLAALLLAPMIDWRDRALLRDSILLATLLMLSMLLQVLGLTLMSAGRNAFVTGLNVVIVPLLLALGGTRLRLPHTLAAVLATLGIAVMSFEAGGNLLGDVLTGISALCFAVYVLAMERLAGRHRALALAGGQAVAMCLLSLLWIGGEAWWWGGAYAGMAWRAGEVRVELLYLGVACSAGALVLQTWAQARVSAVQAAVVYALEPFFAALVAAWWLGEVLGARGIAGGILVVIAMMISQWPARPHAGGEHPHAPG